MWTNVFKSEVHFERFQLSNLAINEFAKIPSFCYHTVMKNKIFFIASAMLLFTGCFTISETPFPEVVSTSLDPNKNLSVQISGFDATVTTYIPVYGYETIHSSIPYGRRGRRHYSTVISTETYIPQINNTTAYLNRAIDILEKCGFTVQTPAPKYRINVVFSGPFVSNSEDISSFAWALFSFLTLDYGVQTWTAQMKIYDVATGKVCMHKDYTQKYESYVWGPLPIFSPAGSEKSNENYMQNWCLSALTDRALADATAFLATR
jgi:hypothetical protein